VFHPENSGSLTGNSWPGGFHDHSHNEGINGSIPGTGVRVIKPGTLRGAALSPGTDGIIPGPEG